MRDYYDVIIYGSGYAGASASLFLLEKGKSVLLVEQEPGVSHKSYFGGIGPDGLVLVSKNYMNHIEELGVRIRPRRMDDDGLWINGMNLLTSILHKAFMEGLDIVVDSLLEPVFRPDENDGFTVEGVMVKGYGTDFSDIHSIPRTSYLVDASAGAGLVALVSERLKLDLPINGVGVNIPGSREIVERTGWLIPGIIAAGLAAAQVVGAPTPFPDVGPLIASGVRAGMLVIEGYTGGNRGLLAPGII